MNDPIDRPDPYGASERRCPDCGQWATADHVDNGIGMERCGPFVCAACGWIEPPLRLDF